MVLKRPVDDHGVGGRSDVVMMVRRPVMCLPYFLSISRAHLALMDGIYLQVDPTFLIFDA